jgi:hypothetical protein
MRVEGVELPPSHAAELAMLLERGGWSDAAQRLGRAVDGNAASFSFQDYERLAVLSVLVNPPDGLGKLKARLIEQARPHELGS